MTELDLALGGTLAELRATRQLVALSDAAFKVSVDAPPPGDGSFDPEALALWHRRLADTLDHDNAAIERNLVTMIAALSSLSADLAARADRHRATADALG